MSCLDTAQGSSCDWSRGAEDVVGEFFREPGNPIVSIDRARGELRASLGLPKLESCQEGFFFYALRSHWQIFDEANLPESVLCGTVATTGIQSSFLNFLIEVYVHVADAASEEWPGQFSKKFFTLLGLWDF